MKNAFFLILYLLMAAGLFAQTDSLPDELQIRQIRLQSNDAFRQHGVGDIIRSWTHDITISTGSGAFISNRDSIKLFVEKKFAELPDLVYVRKTEEVIVSKSGLLAWEKGSWEATRTEHPDFVPIGGHYAIQWIKIEGQWLQKSQLFVSLY